MVEQISAPIIQLRCAVLWLRLIKVKPAMSSMAAAVLRAALILGRSETVIASFLLQQFHDGRQQFGFHRRVIALEDGTRPALLVDEDKKRGMNEQVVKLLPLVGFLFQGGELEATHSQVGDLFLSPG